MDMLVVEGTHQNYKKLSMFDLTHQEREKKNMPWLINKDASIPLTRDQVEKILKRYDTNGDGKLSKQELKVAFKEMGLRFSGWKASRAFHHADMDRDGYINKEEMSELVKYASKWGIKTY